MRRNLFSWNSLTPLSDLSSGEEAIVEEFLGGRGIYTKLYAMGITPGVRIRVLSMGAGPILLEVRGFKLALGRGMASRILVRKV